jgi:uncharacterized protein
MLGPETKMVAMRDGVRLITDIYLSEGGGPFPVLLGRTPYGRHLAIRREITAAADAHPASRAAIAAFFAAAGYAVAYQDCRGR